MSTTTASKPATSAAKPTNYKQAMFVIGSMFFILGFVTWLNSLLIPFLKQACELTDFVAYFVAFAFYISYFVMAIPSSMILKKIGFTKGMSLSLIVMAIGALIFVPAAQTRSYPIFLAGLFTTAAGMTLLQAAVNPYITIIGPIESAAQRMSIMGICNKLAGMIGIFVLSLFLFKDSEALSAKIATLSGAEKELELDLLASRVIVPYIIMAAVLIVLAVVVRKSSLPEPAADDETVDHGPDPFGRTSAFQIPYLVLGVLCLFLYVGVEVLAIDSLTLYGESQGLTKEIASKLGIFSLIAFTAGYLIGVALVPKVVSQKTAFVICAVLGIVFTIGALLTSGNVSIGFMVALSFAHSLMWPGIWPLAINKLGKFTKFGSALLIMGIAGGAILPIVYGAMADAMGDRQLPYIIMIPCYLFMVYYALSGSKKGLPQD
ncbi:glucose/galactose transporter [Chitinophaga skermanii]|uniref:Glucose/galactose transporter n=1 Tax=Chitinophaga skermanii TaxID=331697 RepID=A0A327Q4C9_9BACT|nr:sugar MFS transporter [Chitinophaga skermanii]RAI99365.1 glucose/galactose transporter [Chitinophaga skermanii]